VLGVQALPGLPYDGRNLGGQIDQVQRLTGEPVARVKCRQGLPTGYRGHGLAAPEIHVTASGRRR